MLIKSRFVIGSAIALFALSACSKTEKPADAEKNPVVATVNGKPILKNQVDLIITQQAAQGMPDTPEMRKMIIENLALQQLAAQEAVKKGLDKKTELAEQIEMTKLSLLADGFVQDYMKTNPVTDAMLATEYDKLKTTATGSQFQARHILVETEAEAKAIIAQIKKDVKVFSAIAKAKSKDTGSAIKGGDLGWFDPRSMVPEFSGALAKLEKGQFTQEPVKSQFGYHVIILDDTRANPVPTLEQLKPRLTQQIQQQNLKKLLDDMKAKAKIDIVGEKAASASASASATLPAPATPAAAASASASAEVK